MINNNTHTMKTTTYNHKGQVITIDKVKTGMGNVHVFFTITHQGKATTHRVDGRYHAQKTPLLHVLELHFGETILYHGCGIWNFC